MNANIDQNACNGCELCAKVCSGVFRMNKGKALVAVSFIPDDLQSACRQSMRDCPSRAISLGEARGLMLSGGDGQVRSWTAL